MELFELIGGMLAKRASGESRGMWSYLTERVRARNRLEVTREQNRSTKDNIEALADGGYLYESDFQGRTRIIDRPARGVGPDNPQRDIIDALPVDTVDTVPTPSSATGAAALESPAVPVLDPGAAMQFDLSTPVNEGDHTA
ncbi:hypothetical protein [Nocardia brasiliensis]|uniref:hypothetical protein n=1 Tax=Nocardia brasiliensis TaxID=37326 RepID=UPI003D8D4E9A